MKRKLLEDTKAYITKNDFIGKMKVWRESTSTSPGSKRPLGHYKVLLTTPPATLDKDKKEAWKRRQEYIIECYVEILNFCMHHRYVLNRWKNVTSMIVYKEKGNVKIHQLRIILI